MPGQRVGASCSGVSPKQKPTSNRKKGKICPLNAAGTDQDLMQLEKRCTVPAPLQLQQRVNPPNGGCQETGSAARLKPTEPLLPSQEFPNQVESFSSMPVLPPTAAFPAELSALERQELEDVYFELRGSYSSLMRSRGQFRGQAERNRKAMHELEAKLRSIAEREASIRKEAYEMLEIVTNVVGELEDAGDDLVNEFGAYQMGRRSYQGGAFFGRLLKAITTFIRRWTGTKEQLTSILEKQAVLTKQMEGSDGKDR